MKTQATTNRVHLPSDTNRSLSASVAHVLVAYIFWFFVSGFSPLQSLSITMIVIAVGLWGFALIVMLIRQFVDTDDIGFWLAGPSLGLGALLLLLLRALLTESVFISVFIVGSLGGVLVIGVWLRQRRTLVSAPFRLASLDIRGLLRMLLLVGVSLITPTRLVGGWSWVYPIVGALGASLLLLELSRNRKLSVIAATTVLTGIVTLVSVSEVRRNSWWRVAEGIPFDESILETISNGLIKWGPTTDPLFHANSGASAFAYHHLLYLIVGLINRLTDPEPFRVLLVAAPVFLGVGIVSTVLLLVKLVVRATVLTGVARAFLLMAIVATLMRLDVDGTVGPSSWFGTLSVLGSFLLIFRLMNDRFSRGASMLLACSVVVVGFSKGPYVWFPVVVTSVVALFEWRVWWRYAIIAATSGALLAVFFQRNQDFAQTASLTFWPSSLMGDEFDPSFYSLLVFVDVLINLIIPGIACAAILVMVGTGQVKRLAIAIAVTMVLAICVGLSLESIAADVYRTPGLIGSALMILLMLSTVNQFQTLRWTHAAVVLLMSIVLRRVDLLNSQTLTSISVGAAMSVALVYAIKNRRLSSLIPTGMSRPQLIAGSALFIVILTLLQSFPRSFPLLDWPRLTDGRRPATSYEDWYGSPEFVEMENFVESNTDASSLFAYSFELSQKEIDEYDIDYRPAALMSRRFLALQPQLRESDANSQFWKDANSQLWKDVLESSRIGVASARETVEYLSGRGVSYVLLERSRINPKWLRDASATGARIKFENDQLLLMELGN